MQLHVATVHEDLDCETTGMLIYVFVNPCVFVLVSSRYAIRDGNKIKIFKNFKERKSFKPEYGAESEYQDSISLRPIHPSICHDIHPCKLYIKFV